MDTNIIIKSVSGSLGKSGAALLEDTDNLLYYSPASIWEMVTKHRLGKLKMPLGPSAIQKELERKGCRELAMTSRHALATGTLAEINKDPFDRMLIAQALTEGLTLITTDRLLADYSNDVIVVS